MMEKPKKLWNQPKGKENRIRRLRSLRWISYAHARQLLDKLDYLHKAPPDIRPDCFMILGASNNGKTRLLRHFWARNKGVRLFKAKEERKDVDRQEVLYVLTPAVGKLRALLEAILGAMGVPADKSTSIPNLHNKVLSAMEDLQPGMLIFDEIGHIALSPPGEQLNQLHFIKHLGNQFRIPIVVAGIPEAQYMFLHDAQLSNRFDVGTLPEWKLDGEYSRLLGALKRQVDLRGSYSLTERNIAKRIYNMSEKLIGETCDIVTEAAARAIEDGTEKITEEILDELQWRRPSDRRRKIQV